MHIVARLASAMVGLLGILALVVAITWFGDRRSTQTSVGQLTNRTSPASYVSGMVIAAPGRGGTARNVDLALYWDRGSQRQVPAQPGWYPDPTTPAQQRWWDGERWTSAVLDQPHT
jgi:hypothetical protein